MTKQELKQLIKEEVKIVLKEYDEVLKDPSPEFKKLSIYVTYLKKQGTLSAFEAQKIMELHGLEVQKQWRSGASTGFYGK